jgi:electron transport complex protein RnfE
MNAFYHELYLVLGIFIPLIVTNCSIIGRAEAFASRNPPFAAAIDGLMMGLGFTLVLAALGGMREAIGNGTVFSSAELMFGEAAQILEIVIIEDYRGFLLAVLPPGAFIGMGLLIALKNVVDSHISQKQVVVVGLQVQTSL